MPKLFVKGIRTGNIRMIDGIITLSQPYFMMMSTIYAFFHTLIQPGILSIPTF